MMRTIAPIRPINICDMRRHRVRSLAVTFNLSAARSIDINGRLLSKTAR